MELLDPSQLLRIQVTADYAVTLWDGDEVPDEVGTPVAAPYDCDFL